MSLEIKSASVFRANREDVSPVRACVRCPEQVSSEPGRVFLWRDVPEKEFLEAVHTCKERAVIMYLQQRCSDITELAERASSVAAGANMK